MKPFLRNSALNRFPQRHEFPEHPALRGKISKDDEKALYNLLGNKDDRKKFDTQFKKVESYFKIAIVVDKYNERD